MAARVRLVSTLVAVLATAGVLVSSGTAGSRASGPAAYPTLYVMYTMDCTFSIIDDSGKPVTQIAPGTYQVEVETPVFFKLVKPGGTSVDNIAANDFTGCKGWVQFQLTGPGVSLFTTLDTGCDAFLTMPSTYFKPNSTFTATDLNQPTVAHATFSTLQSGTPTIPKSPYGTISGKGSSQGDITGSENVMFRGTLAGTLSAHGKPALTTKGKSISVLKAGSYKFAINDQDAKGGFTLQRLKSDGSMNAFKPNELTGVKFVGKHSKTLTLKAGHWMYSAGSGTGYHFLVVS